MARKERSIIKRILEKAIVVPREELEVTEIVSGQSLTDTVDVILGLKEGEVKITKLSDKSQIKTGMYIPERKAYLFTPLNQIASVLGIDVRVEFYDISGVPVYFVREPEVTELVKKIYIYLKSRIGEIGLSGADIVEFAKQSFEDLGLDARMAFAEKDVKSAVYYVWRDLIGYGPLEIPMEDAMVEEVSWFSYDGPVLVVDKKVADIYPNAEFVFTNIFLPKYLDELKKKFFMTQIVRAITSRARAGLTTAKPLAEARIPDPSGRGFHRLAAHLDITSRSPGLTIRKFPQIKLSLTKLIHYNTLSSLEAAYLVYQLIKRGFILIVGGMASGKSVGKDSHFLIRRNGNVRLVTVESLWAELVKDGFSPVINNGMEVIENPDIEILSLNRNGVRWYRPKYLIRHRYNGKMFKIRTKTGRAIEVTPDHSLLVWSVGDEKDRFNIILKPIRPSEIKRKAYLPYLRKVNLPEKVGINKRVNDPRFGYLIGFFVAEGYFNGYTPRIHQSVGTILSHVLDYMTKLGMSYRVSPEKRKPHLRYISILDREIRKFINPREIGRKAREKRIPTLFWNMSEEWRCAFLAGIIDGDGTVHTGKYIIEITTASEELAYGLLYAFATVGVHAYLRTKKIKKYPDRVYYRVFVPISINKEPVKRIMKWLSTEKRIKIEEAIRKSSNHHSETDIVPADIVYAIGSQLKRLEHGRDESLSFELRSYKYKGENPSFHRIEKILGEKLFEFIPRHVGFDEVVEITEEDYDGYVYDLEVPETENFEANGIFVHNTTLLQALISALPISYKVVTIEDTPELSTPAQNWHPLYVRRAPKESELENVDFSRLVIHSLRHRGTVVTLGEVRGKEMADLIQAAASVSRDTPVLVRIDGEVRLAKIGEIVDAEYGDAPEWTKVVPKRKIEVLTLTRDGKVEFRPVAWVLRHKHEGILYRVWYQSSKNPAVIGYVEITGNHSIFVKRGDKIVAERGDALKLGDKIIMAVKDMTSWVHSEGRVIRIEQKKYNDYVYDFSVPETEAFFGGNSAFILLHNSGHGAICLRPDARVVVKLGEKEHVLRMEEVYREIMRGTKLEILSYDLRSGKLTWKRITKAFHVKTKAWVRIYTVSGRVIDVTPDHQLPVLDDKDAPAIKPAGEVKVGEKLLVAPPLPKVGKVKKFLIVSNRYIEIDGKLGRLYGTVLARGRIYSKKLTIPKDADPQAIKVLNKVSRIRVGRTRISASQNAVRLIERLEEIIRAHPLSLPAVFLQELYRTLKKYDKLEVLLSDEDLAYALHYALRTINVDSVVHGDTLRILGEVRGLMADTVTRVEILEPMDFEDAYDIEVEDTHTFITESSIISMNCTFHAHDPNTVLARITSPPINAAPESLLLITSIVHIAYTKTFVHKRPEPVRRVMRIFEITDVRGRRAEAKTVFTWSPMEDKHNPPFNPYNLRMSTEALKHLWEHSRTVRILGENTYGQDEPYRALVDIYTLAYFLEEMRKKEVFDIKMLLLKLSAFYLKMDTISDMLWNRYFKKLFREYGIIERR